MSSGKTKYGVSEIALMGWSELRDGLADYLPAETIHLNKRFSRFQQHDDHVQLHFTDGTSVEAKIVVGADGCFSRIRQQTLVDGLPDFTVSCMTTFNCFCKAAHLIRQSQWTGSLYSHWGFHTQQDAWLTCSLMYYMHQQ